jgi:hypothetical protein
MAIQYDIVYSDINLFFELNGNNLMRLTPDAAIELCNALREKDVVVVCVEGGIWNDGKFQARLDTIWTGKKPPMNPVDLAINNEKAIASILEDREQCNAFIVSTLPNAELT